MSDVLGEVVGNYRITELIGTGGMGGVYLAEHVLLGKRAAVKVLLPERCESREMVDRFFNEAKAASLIKDPGIVDIFDYGRLASGNAYIVMELLDGETLGERLRREGKISASQTASIARHIAGTLTAAHDAGIIHRDLKPDNVFLVRDPALPRGERAKLLDFGIAKLAPSTQPIDMVRTETGRLMGTPYYMSPEQCRGAGQVDHRTDAYSLGCVMFQALTGRPPFVMEGAGEILAAHIHLPPPAPRALEPSIPKPLEDVVVRLIEKDPARRYQTMADVVQALNHAMAQTPERERPEPSLAPSNPFRPPATGPAPRFDPTADTTLTSSSGELRFDATVSTRPRRRAWPWAAAVITVAGAAIAFTLATRTFDDPEQAPPRAAARPRPARREPVRPSVPQEVPQPKVEALAGQAPVPPDQVAILIASDPDGATVYRQADGVRLGKTPLRIQAQRGEGEAVFILRRSGYHSERITLPVTGDQHQVVVLRAKVERPRAADVLTTDAAPE